MALTDADRLKMTDLALMRHSVIEREGGGGSAYQYFNIDIESTSPFSTWTWNAAYYTITPE